MKYLKLIATFLAVSFGIKSKQNLHIKWLFVFNYWIWNLINSLVMKHENSSKKLSSDQERDKPAQISFEILWEIVESCFVSSVYY